MLYLSIFFGLMGIFGIGQLITNSVNKSFGYTLLSFLLCFITYATYKQKKKTEQSINNVDNLQTTLKVDNLQTPTTSNTKQRNSSRSNDIFPTKVGIRDVSISKSLSAKTTGKVKKQIKSTFDPTYNVKGMGMIKNPKRAIKNKIYKKTTKSVKSLFK